MTLLTIFFIWCQKGKIIVINTFLNLFIYFGQVFILIECFNDKIKFLIFQNPSVCGKSKFFTKIVILFYWLIMLSDANDSGWESFKVLKYLFRTIFNFEILKILENPSVFWNNWSPWKLFQKSQPLSYCFYVLKCIFVSYKA